MNKEEKIKSLKDYKGKPFDPKDSLGDELMEYEYYLLGQANE